MLRLKVKRQEEQRISKVKDLIQMLKVPGFPTYEYQPIGGSSLPSNWTSPNIDPTIQKTKGLFEMFQIDR